MRLLLLPLVFVLASACRPAAHVPASDHEALGELDFPITGSAECQRRFRHGMLAFHSFLYEQAHESFIAALAADAGCAMAAWGDAMTYDHPIWKERDPATARAALARVTDAESLSARERAYLAAAHALFAVDDAKSAHRAWLAEAAAMQRAYPDDDEVQLQYVLALLAVYGYDPAHVREQMEAGSLALQVFERRPSHPGAAHYIIHAFDSSDHAILALPAARTYARIAPAAGHAQHMPSHTFVHLGMWREVVPSNEVSIASEQAWSDAHGQSPSRYAWHSYSWLVAAHMELGQHARARQLIDDARALLVAATDDSGDFRYDYANMVAVYLSHTERWGDLESLSAPVLAPALDEGSDGAGPVACAMHAPGGANIRLPKALLARLIVHILRAEAAIVTGDVDTVVQRVADLGEVRAQMAPWATMLPPSYLVHADAVDDALLARSRGGTPAIEAMERLDALGVTFASAGPMWLRTTQETLGAILLAAGRPADALVQYERDLAARPNRAVALLGAARAAKAAGDPARARAHYRMLAELWRDADADLVALDEVRAGT